MGRKAWLFANSIEGANAAAIIYSLIETGKHHHVQPYRKPCRRNKTSSLIWLLSPHPAQTKVQPNNNEKNWIGDKLKNIVAGNIEKRKPIVAPSTKFCGGNSIGLSARFLARSYNLIISP